MTTIGRYAEIGLLCDPKVERLGWKGSHYAKRLQESASVNKKSFLTDSGKC